MGMFDDVKYEHADPLPDGFQGRDFQTKDFECSMVTYRISPEGRLLQPIWHSEEVPKAQRRHPNDDGLLGLCGSIRVVVDRWHDMQYHGDVHFYTYTDGKGWHGYYARFTEGQLVNVRMDEQTAEASSATEHGLSKEPK